MLEEVPPSAVMADGETEQVFCHLSQAWLLSKHLALDHWGLS